MQISSGEDYSEQRFESLEAKALTLEDNHFENCVFAKCNFSGAIFENCDLSNMQVQGASLRSVSFKDCKAVGINWAGANSVTHLNFEKCVINYAVFGGLDLKKSALKNCVAREADFEGTNLSEVDCRGTDFAGARFANTNLTKADLRGATSYSIRPDANKIKKARFSLPEATLLLYGLDIELEE
jgi:fluoroquinolone resistance protein